MALHGHPKVLYDFTSYVTQMATPLRGGPGCPVPWVAVGEVQARRRAAQSDRAAAPARPHTGRKPVSPDLMICGVPVRVWERVRVRVRARVRVGVRVVDRMS